MPMKHTEESYFLSIQEKIEHFGVIQRDFIYEKTGIASLVRLIASMGGSLQELSLRDPVILKGRRAAERVILSLSREVEELRSIEPPPLWLRYHQMMISSLELQIEGYREMVLVFEDNEIRHIGRGKDIVKKGMSILEGGMQII